jgi:glycosyltransferase involved in cell wall biosynthesis
MPRFTIIIPTTAHRETIRFAIESVLDQTLGDFELVVIGDGCPQRTVEIVNSFSDPRLRIVQHPKSPGTGENYRDAVIRESEAINIAYLEDDDLWTRDHLETVDRLLNTADFCHTHWASITVEGEVCFLPGTITHPHIRACMSGSVPFNVVPLGTAGHRRESYLRLPVGWSTRPEGWWSDLWMWRKWLAEDWVRITTDPQVTFLRMAQAERSGWSPIARFHEIAHWYYRSRNAGFSEWIGRRQTTELLRVASDWVQAVHNVENLRLRLRDLGEQEANT